MLQEHRELEFNQVLALVVAAKNNLTMIAGVTPHQAVFGRPGHLLPNTEEATVTSDLSTVNRAREIAASSIVEEHAKQRMTRALRHQSRPAVEEFAYEPGTAVDFYTPQVGKETPTWRGPAQIVSVQPGSVTLRWQSRTMERRTQEVRPHIILLCHFVGTPSHTLWTDIRRSIEQLLNAPATITLGAILTQKGWQLTSRLQTSEGRTLYDKVQYLVSALGLSPPMAFRISTGCKSTAQLVEYLQCT
eukprot:1274963-Amphidinium_carterae.1